MKRSLMTDFNEGMSWVYLAITLQYDSNAKAILQNILTPPKKIPMCTCGHIEAQHIEDSFKGYIGCKECNCDYFYPEDEYL